MPIEVNNTSAKDEALNALPAENETIETAMPALAMPEPETVVASTPGFAFSSDTPAPASPAPPSTPTIARCATASTR